MGCVVALLPVEWESEVWGMLYNTQQPREAEGWSFMARFPERHGAREAERKEFIRWHCLCDSHTHEAALCVRTSALLKTYIEHVMGVDIMEEMKLWKIKETAEDDNAKHWRTLRSLVK